jgi:hypothetical protein
LHNEHVEWNKRIAFYRDEISSFENRLSDIVKSNTKTEVLAPLEHFQNQFIRQKQVMDNLEHDINAYETIITNIAKENNVATDRKRTEDHTELRERMSQFDKLFGELKDEFTKYLSEVY